MIMLEKDRLEEGRKRYSLKNSSGFKEEEHPRDESGRFGEGTGKTTEEKTSQKKERRTIEKKGIKNIYEYMSKELEKMGFDIETSGSGLSDSEYITIKNWTEVTGKQGVNGDDSLKIRVSNHDLPPSYDTLHGMYDMDIRDGIKSRSGSEGLAENYDTALAEIARKAKKEVPTHIKSLQDQNKKDKEKSEERHKKFIEEEQKKAEEKETAKSSGKFEEFIKTNPSKSEIYRTVHDNPEMKKSAIKFYEKKLSETPKKEGVYNPEREELEKLLKKIKFYNSVSVIKVYRASR